LRTDKVFDLNEQYSCWKVNIFCHSTSRSVNENTSRKLSKQV